MNSQGIGSLVRILSSIDDSESLSLLSFLLVSLGFMVDEQQRLARHVDKYTTIVSNDLISRQQNAIRRGYNSNKHQLRQIANRNTTQKRPVTSNVSKFKLKRQANNSDSDQNGLVETETQETDSDELESEQDKKSITKEKSNIDSNIETIEQEQRPRKKAKRTPLVAHQKKRTLLKKQSAKKTNATRKRQSDSLVQETPSKIPFIITKIEKLIHGDKNFTKKLYSNSWPKSDFNAKLGDAETSWTRFEMANHADGFSFFRKIHYDVLYMDGPELKMKVTKNLRFWKFFKFLENIYPTHMTRMTYRRQLISSFNSDQVDRITKCSTRIGQVVKLTGVDILRYPFMVNQSLLRDADNATFDLFLKIVQENQDKIKQLISQ